MALTFEKIEGEMKPVSVSPKFPVTAQHQNLLETFNFLPKLLTSTGCDGMPGKEFMS